MQALENKEQWLDEFREGWLAHCLRTGAFEGTLYRYAANTVPPPGSGINLAASRLMLVSSAGAYLPGRQEPFDAENVLGDYSIRLFAHSTPLDELDYAHTHYDQEAVRRDPQVLLPLRHLEELVAEGIVGEVAPSVVSFMGYQPDISRVVDETLPAVLRMAQEEQVRAALLVPA